MLVVLGCSWLVRAAVIATWPRSAHSDDLDSWITVAHQLNSGANPYVTTTIVKWPPFAIVVVWLIDHAARGFGVSFFMAMRVALIGAESAIVVVLYVLLTRFAPARTVRWLLIVGISLNPMAILFVCQHENIDVFVGLFVALALWALVVYDRTNDVVPWLAGCLALGLGAFTKTVPLVLRAAPRARLSRCVEARSDAWGRALSRSGRPRAERRLRARSQGRSSTTSFSTARCTAISASPGCSASRIWTAWVARTTGSSPSC